MRLAPPITSNYLHYAAASTATSAALASVPAALLYAAASAVFDRLHCAAASIAEPANSG